MSTCFVCDSEGADIWLPGPDVRVCSEDCMKLFFEEWVKQEDPLNRYKRQGNSENAENSNSEQT